MASKQYEALTNNVAAFTYVDKRLYDKDSVMLAAIKHDYTYFDRASAKLKADETFLQQALAINPEVVKRLVHTREEALERVRKNGLLLRYLPKYARDEGVCVAAMEQNPEAVEWIDDEFLSYDSWWVAAVRGNGLRLKNAPGHCQYDTEICLAAIKQNATAFQYVGQALKNNLFFQSEAIRANPKFIQQLPPIRDFQALMSHLSRGDDSNWGHDKAFAIHVVTKDGSLLSYFKHFFKDREVCLCAVAQHRGAIAWVDDSLLTEPTLALAAVELNNKRFSKIAPQLKSDKVICLAALKIDDSAFAEIDVSLHDDMDIMFAAIKHNHLHFNEASERLKTHKGFMSQVIKANSQVVVLMPYSEYNQTVNEVFGDALESHYTIHGEPLQDLQGEWIGDHRLFLDVYAIRQNPAIYFDGIIDHAKDEDANFQYHLDRAARIVFKLMHERMMKNDDLRNTVLKKLGLKTDYNIATLKTCLQKGGSVTTKAQLEEELRSLDQLLKDSHIDSPVGYPFEIYQREQILFATHALASLKGTAIPEHDYPEGLFESEETLKFIWDNHVELLAAFDKHERMKDVDFLKKAIAEKPERLGQIPEALKTSIGSSADYQKMWIAKPSLFPLLPEFYRTDPAFLLSTLKKTPEAQRSAIFRSWPDKKNTPLMHQVLAFSPTLWAELPEDLKTNAFIVEMIGQHWDLLKHLEPKYYTPSLIEQLIVNIELASLQLDWVTPYLKKLKTDERQKLLLSLAQQNPLICNTPLFAEALTTRAGLIKYAAAKVQRSLLQFKKIAKSETQRQAIAAFVAMLEKGEPMAPDHLEQFKTSALNMLLTSPLKTMKKRMNLDLLGENFQAGTVSVDDIIALFHSNPTAAKVMPILEWHVPIKTVTSQRVLKNITAALRREADTPDGPTSSGV